MCANLALLRGSTGLTLTLSGRIATQHDLPGWIEKESVPTVSVELEVGSSSSKLQQRPGGQVYSSSANVSVSCLCVRVCMD